jgi:hypothetical protein
MDERLDIQPPTACPIAMSTASGIAAQIAKNTANPA